MFILELQDVIPRPTKAQVLPHLVSWLRLLGWVFEEKNVCFEYSQVAPKFDEAYSWSGCNSVKKLN